MKSKKILTFAAILALGLPLAGCGNQAKPADSEPVKEESVQTEEAKSDEEKTEGTEVTKEDETSNGEKASGDKDLQDLETSYLPEDFQANFTDEKQDLITTEYSPEKNPAKKITVQLSNNDERIAELAKVPDDAEDITIGANTGKFWDDGSFNYIFIKDGANTIFTRSNLEKDEAVKVVEGIK